MGHKQPVALAGERESKQRGHVFRATSNKESAVCTPKHIGSTVLLIACARFEGTSVCIVLRRLADDRAQSVGQFTPPTSLVCPLT